MKKNTGKEYELLSQKIYQALLISENFSNIEVKHNVNIQGKDTKHQIDIYWEREIDGSIRKFLVEAKDYKKPVSKDKIGAFLSVIRDVPNSVGIFIAKSGFQKDAKEWAEKNQVQLCELRDYKEDFEGKMMKLKLNISIKGTDKTYSCIEINGYEKIGKVLYDVTNKTIKMFDKNNKII